jgi:hypothetical protein
MKHAPEKCRTEAERNGWGFEELVNCNFLQISKKF